MAKDLSVGFMIYGDPIPEEALYAFDWLVVDPDSTHTKRVMNAFYLRDRRVKLIAYVSVGEAEPYRNYFKEVKKDWILGENKVWKSYVTDLRSEEYINFLLERVFPRLKQFDGFFLDTLDSHQLFLKEGRDLETARNNLAKLVKILKQTYPDKLILLNRGFEVMEATRGYADAIVAESLFHGITYDEKKEYKPMKAEDTQWLMEKLNKAVRLGYKVIVIDYVDPRDRDLQLRTARKIYELGFVPYVSDKYLRTFGVSSYKLKPRRILMLYSRELYKDPSISKLSRIIQPWLEYLGYVPVLMEIERAILDDRLNYFMGDIYAGIVVEGSGYKDGEKLHKWLLKKKEEGIKVFFLDSFGFPEENQYLKDFGIKVIGRLSLGQSYIAESSSFEFFEVQPVFDRLPMTIPNGVKEHIKVRAGGAVFYPLAVTEWGGYALFGSLTVQHEDLTLFVVDPLKLFSKVFEPYKLVPDVTTENGRRILLVHIDGDAFFGRADFEPSKNVAEVIRDEIIRKYPIPHTVSIIEGEIAPHGLYPKEAPKLEEIARSIFSLDNVELASHTFSHPFKWQELEILEKTIGEAVYHKDVAFNLPIEGYKFDLRREIEGSIEYINRQLAPKDKKVKVFLWSGDANPSEEAIRQTYEAGVYNINGGYTWINRENPYRMFIGPMGVNKGEYFQIYAPIMNENIYTNLWTDFYGFVRVIDTFLMTEKPYRIKPMNIYYHMYSGQKIASLEALRKVYSWALSQEPIPLFLSEYAQKVLDFRSAAFLEHIADQSFIVRSGSALRTLRIDRRVHVDTSRSKGVVGYKQHGDVTYVSLDASGDYVVAVSENPPAFNVLSSNGRVLDFIQKDGYYRFTLKAYVPLELELVAPGCKLQVSPTPDKQEKIGSLVKISYVRNKDVRVEAYCKK
ncbi:MAG: endo alpha-1,4 polygalactosaminidase [Aquificaceae bacterium]|nr:endo alpha-1,4 polygalactosaminidase [Aquificaceae bacterium]MDW8423387.1 endo alpha-1,4 polygalactosaminidase [Aquificaceae bacterium]